MNIFTLDNLKKFESSDSNDNMSVVKPVDIVNNLNAYAIQVSPERFYDRNITPNVYVKVFSDLFTLFPRWIFNLWIDNSKVINSNGTYDYGGIWIHYKNGTASQLINVPVYDGTSTPEYKHAVFISSASDLVSHITFRYNYLSPSYYRIDSTITPYTDDIKINKTGELGVSSLFESKLYIPDPKNETCDASFKAGGVVECNQIIEY